MQESIESSLTHSYFRHHARLFDLWRDEPISVLEIGFEDVNSLRMWERYFVRAQLILVDANPANVPSAEGRRIVEVCADGDIGLLTGLADKYRPTIVLDHSPGTADRGHLAFAALFPLLQAGGVYIVEGARATPGERGAGVVSYFLNLAARIAFADRSVAVDSELACHVEAVEIFQGDIVVRKHSIP